MATDVYAPEDVAPYPSGGDFTLDPNSVAKGKHAARSYIDSLKTADSRKGAEEALDTLALLITAGVCGVEDFPWQQLRAYHGAAVMKVLKEEGTPARVEAYRFERDPNRKFRPVLERFPTKHSQQARTALRHVIQESWRLGYLTDEQRDRALVPQKVQGNRSPRRTLRSGELRALITACELDGSAAGNRDALMLWLGFDGGLCVGEIVAANLQDLGFDIDSGQTVLHVRKSRFGDERRVSLRNGTLIALEDWVDRRGREDGPLLCPLKRGRAEQRRLTAADLRSLCRERAEEAGVEPFSPDDLALSGAAELTAGLDPSAALTGPGAVAAVGDDEGMADPVLQFPFLSRLGR